MAPRVSTTITFFSKVDTKTISLQVETYPVAITPWLQYPDHANYMQKHDLAMLWYFDIGPKPDRVDFSYRLTLLIIFFYPPLYNNYNFEVSFQFIWINLKNVKKYSLLYLERYVYILWCHVFFCTICWFLLKGLYLALSIEVIVAFENLLSHLESISIYDWYRYDL